MSHTPLSSFLTSLCVLTRNNSWNLPSLRSRSMPVQVWSNSLLTLPPLRSVQSARVLHRCGVPSPGHCHVQGQGQAGDPLWAHQGVEVGVQQGRVPGGLASSRDILFSSSLIISSSSPIILLNSCKSRTPILQLMHACHFLTHLFHMVPKQWSGASHCDTVSRRLQRRKVHWGPTLSVFQSHHSWLSVTCSATPAVLHVAVVPSAATRI